MQVRSKLERVSDELFDMSQQIRQMLDDGKVDERELRELAELARQQMPDAINEVESAIVDNVLESQILKLGHEGAPNRHLNTRIIDLEAVRASRQRKTASQAGGPLDAA